MNYFIKLVLLITLSTIVKTKKIRSCTEEKTIALTVNFIIFYILNIYKNNNN